LAKCNCCRGCLDIKRVNNEKVLFCDFCRKYYRIVNPRGPVLLDITDIVMGSTTYVLNGKDAEIKRVIING
jgi:hypothetical protein